MPEPNLGDDEAVIHSTIGIADHLGHQHVLSISPSDENIVQQLLALRLRVHPRGLLPRRKAEEGVGQQETVFRTRSQKMETIIVTATETVGTQYYLPGSVVLPNAGVEMETIIVTATETVGTQYFLPGSVVLPNAGVEVTKDNPLVCHRHSHQEGVQVLVEFSFAASELVIGGAAEIIKAYRRLAFHLHPDKNGHPGSEEAFKRVVAARTALLGETTARPNGLERNKKAQRNP
ncbi:unnamed protein product [Schistocephalus solidus]|uniref:J domain-containing protein n=1 Tax=Schistocephalus solidus TaxID=70667 RepID=A0A183THD6_SCHSO|nr:unnamed protein product [Schistocephalus solidus]